MQQKLNIRSQWLWMVLIVALTTVLAVALVWHNKRNTSESAAQAEPESAHQEGEKAESAHDENGEKHEAEEKLSLSRAQMQQHNVKLAQVALGDVQQSQQFPAKLVVNSDRQAHVSSSFVGRVESVYVELGQQVKRGQALATLLVPELVDQQANLNMAQSNLNLAQQDYARERELWSQGISAKQDYQRAYNAYRQAQIQVQAARSRLSAFGASSNSSGRYTLTAPISGAISLKDIVMGENVQLSDQLFTIDQLDQLWLQFVLPAVANVNVPINQIINFTSLQTGHQFKAQIQGLNTEADAQTGRLQVRAKVLSNAAELRPNLMVNVALPVASKVSVQRVSAKAIQQIDGNNVLFAAQSNSNKGFDFTAIPVQVGLRSADGQWVEITQGVSVGQSYVTDGSFLLKSELEKGEAEHGH